MDNMTTAELMKEIERLMADGSDPARLSLFKRELDWRFGIFQ